MVVVGEVMADPKKTSVGAKAKGKKKAGVIDVGEQPETEDSSQEDSEDEEEASDDAGADVDMAASMAGAIDVGDETTDDVEVPEPKEDTRGGSLAKRDPLGAYMRETRRYPLLTPDEEKELAIRL